MSEAFKILNAINVNDYTEKKNGLTYLSWANAFAELKKAYPDATYKIRQFDGKPYLYDENLGYMVMTEMTVDGITHEMWLPVMDNTNKAMKDREYTVKKGKYESTVQPATMFDINTAIMRCLTKNIAMFGLGLYIYAGEDLPEESEERKAEENAKAEDKKKTDEIGKMKIAPVKVECIKERCKESGIPEEKVLKLYKIAKFEDMSENQFRNAFDHWKEIVEK
jgi:hypothetical protein